MSTGKFILVFSSMIVMLAAAGCGEDDRAPGDGEADGTRIGLVVDYPLEGSVFPPDFLPPTFLWHDDTPGVDAFRIVVTFTGGGDPIQTVSSGPPPPRGEIDPQALGPTNEIYEPTAYQKSARSWAPTATQWQELKGRSVEGPATVTIQGIARDKPDQPRSTGRVTISTSTDPVGAPIFYRDVPLMPSQGEDGTISPLAKDATHKIAWRLRDVSKPESKVILTGMPSCANCHSFSADGETMGMDVDGPTGDKGAYAIAPLAQTTVIGDQEVITWNSFPGKFKDHKTIGFLSRISPDGGYALTTVNERLYVSNFTDYRFLQVFFPTRGTLAWYSRDSQEMAALPGADDTDYVHCSPVWFPDGQEIIFARAQAFDPYPEGLPRATYSGDPNEPRIQFDLYRMPFNDGKGGTPVPIEGASHNGMSNTFPKISPDGRWLVVTRCENGLLMRRDSRLWIMPARGGVAREMNCNTSLMNSWHSFSPNSRWMVFSSKSNTPYTQMFLTHIDEDGNDTPAILIENSTASNRAVNIPEFLNRPYEEFDSIEVPAVSHFSALGEGIKLADMGRHAEAVVEFERALESDPEFSRALTALGYSLVVLGRVEEAREKLKLATEIEPDSPVTWVNLGHILMQEGRIDEAAELFEKAIQIESNYCLAHHNFGLARFRQGRFGAARNAFRIAAELEPQNADVRNALGGTLEKMGRPDEAIVEYRIALECDPDHPRALGNLAVGLLRAGETEEALGLLRRAVVATPADSQLTILLCDLLVSQQRAAEAMKHLEAMIRTAPDDLAVKLQMAWLLSTLPDDSLRDGPRAVRLAESCRERSGERADILDVLAAAYAEAGRFPDAVKAAVRAAELSRDGEGAARPGLPDRLAGYRAGRPHRE